MSSLLGRPVLLFHPADVNRFILVPGLLGNLVVTVERRVGTQWFLVIPKDFPLLVITKYGDAVSQIKALNNWILLVKTNH